MKFGNSVADIFILDNSTVHCLGVQFFRGHSVILATQV